ncbi:MAG: hypothetical protein U0610_19650 [bacterium]
MNQYFFTHMLLAGLAVLGAVWLVWMIGRYAAPLRRLLRIAALTIAVPPVVFYTSTLAMLPLWASVPWGVIVALAYRALRRHGIGRTTAIAGLGAYSVFHTWLFTCVFFATSPGCEAVWRQPGAVRLDSQPDTTMVAILQNRGEYGLDVDPEERFAYATYAHGGQLSGVVRVSLEKPGDTQRVDLGARGILHARFEPSTRRIYAVDHKNAELYVLDADPFRLVQTVQMKVQAPMDLAFDPAAGQVLVIDRTEIADAPNPGDRFAGLVAFDLAAPGAPVGRYALDNHPGANEIITVPGERRAFVTSEGFITLCAYDYASHTSQLLFTGIPGIGGGAVDAERRELYLSHTIGLVQVRDVDRFDYKRTLFVRGARAVTVDPVRKALYVADFFNGRVKRVDPESGSVLGSVRVGVRMRQMKVLRDGRLLTASACGIGVLNPP